MEIISYVVNGELTHGDSMGNNNTVTRGQVQYMSAGTGVLHSEYNLGKIHLGFCRYGSSCKNGLDPNYGDFRFNWEDRKNNWLHMVSDINGNAPIKINQDANIYSLELEQGKNIEFPVKEGRQAYLVQIEGTSLINDVELNDRDGMEIIEENISIKAVETSHILIIEMEKQFED